MIKLNKVIVLIFLWQIITSAQNYVITDYGAEPGNEKNNTKIIQKLVDKASETGGKIIFPAGIFMTGTIELKNNVTIILSKNSIWKGYPDMSLYPDIIHDVRSRMDLYTQKAMVYAINTSNISIIGEGLFYPNGDHEVFQDGISNSPKRPYGIFLINCNDITVKDIKMKHSAFWMQRYLNCTNLRLENLDVYNHANLNNDGLDIDGCKNVFVSNCKIDASDDALCLKTEGHRSTEDVLITNCLLSSHASAFKLGTGSVSNFERITFSNSIIRPSESKEMHHELKYYRGLVGIELLAVDGGGIEDVTISNIIIDSSETPIHLKLGNRHDRVPINASEPTSGFLRNISFQNLIIKNAGTISSVITGYPENYIENISFTDISYESEGGGTDKDNNTEVAEASSTYPVNLAYGSNFPSYGFYVRHTKTISFNNMRMVLKNDDRRPTLYFNDVKDLRLEHISANVPNKNQPAYKLNNCSNVKFFNSSNYESIDKFINIEGEGSRNIWMDTDIFNLSKNIKPPDNFRGTAKSNEYSYINLQWDYPEISDGGFYEYELIKNGEFLTRTRKNSYTDFEASGANVYNYEIRTVNYDGQKSKSTNLQIHGIIDTVVPRIEEIKIIDNLTLFVKFSEPVTEDSFNKDNIILKPSLKIKSIDKIADDRINIILGQPIPINTNYRLTLNSLTDKSSSKNHVDQVFASFIDNPLVGYWNFDYVNKTEVKDNSGNGNHGLNHNGKVIKGIFGSALEFNGTDSYINCGNNESLNMNNNMAVSFWIKRNDKNDLSYSRVVSKKNKWNDKNGYEFEYIPYLNKLNFCGSSDNSNQQGVVYYKLNYEWNHVTALMKNQKVTFYINGEYFGEDTYAENPIPNKANLFIGAMPTKSGIFKGALDEIYLFNRGISKDEIQKLFHGNYEL